MPDPKLTNFRDFYPFIGSIALKKSATGNFFLPRRFAGHLSEVLDV
jgi:hypothetical protein